MNNTVSQQKLVYLQQAAITLSLMHHAYSAPFEEFTIIQKNVMLGDDNIGHFKISIEKFSDEEIEEWHNMHGEGDAII